MGKRWSSSVSPTHMLSIWNSRYEKNTLETLRQIHMKGEVQVNDLQHVLEHLHVLGVHVLFLSTGHSHKLDGFHLDVISSILR